MAVARVYAITAIVSLSPATVSELGRLQAVLSTWNEHLDSKWLPSDVNRFADALSRTWHQGDVRVSQHILPAIDNQYHFDVPVFCARLFGKPRVSQLKVIYSKIQKWWADGMGRRWNPPADLLPMVVRKVQNEKATGVLIAPYWPTQAFFAHLTISDSTSMVYPLDNEDFFVGSTVRKARPLVIAEIRLERISPLVFELPSSVRPVMCQVLAKEMKRHDFCQDGLGSTPLGLLVSAKVHDGWD